MFMSMCIFNSGRAIKSKPYTYMWNKSFIFNVVTCNSLTIPGVPLCHNRHTTNCIQNLFTSNVLIKYPLLSFKYVNCTWHHWFRIVNVVLSSLHFKSKKNTYNKMAIRKGQVNKQFSTKHHILVSTNLLSATENYMYDMQMLSEYCYMKIKKFTLRKKYMLS